MAFTILVHGISGNPNELRNWIHSAMKMDYKALSKHTGISVRTLRTMVFKRQIPYYKLGHRTLMFDPDKVERALQRYEIKEVGRNKT